MNRPIFLKDAKKLTLKLDNIIIEKLDGSLISINLEDTSIVLVDNPSITITSRLLTKASEKCVIFIFCDENYMPSTISLPIFYHFSQVKTQQLQLSIDNILKGLIWQKIINKKIENQREVIKFTSLDDKSYNLLTQYMINVEFNDDSNKEGISSRVFFDSLYGKEFLRFGTSSISKALNYGYSILLGSMVRTLVAYGFNTNFGVWHNSANNPYNLASDLMEVYRSIVDYYVYHNLDRIIDPLPYEIRKGLVSLLSKNIKMDGKVYKLEYSMQVLVESLSKCYKTGNIELLLLPNFLEFPINYEG